MKKLFMTIILFSLLLGGCTGSEDTTAANTDDTWEDESDNTWEEDSDYGETGADYDDSYGDESENGDAYEETVVASYPFIDIYPFSEDRAWVAFGEDEYNCILGIIDTNGKLLYQGNPVNLSSEANRNYFYVSQFQDGLAFYRGNGLSHEDYEGCPCGIIDSDGNVLFETQITPEGGYLILAYGNGHFFVAQHIQNFDTDEWRYGTIDKNGNALNEMKPFNDKEVGLEHWANQSKYFPTIQYIGENFIALPSGLYNIETAQFYAFPCSYVDYREDPIGNFCDGRTCIIDNGYFDIGAYIIDTSYTGIWKDEDDELQGFVCKKDDFYSNSKYSEGLIYGYGDGIESGYYDKDLNLAISLEQNESIVDGGAFNGGYAAIAMRGADGELYASMIDRQGNLLYSPVKTDGFDPDNSSNGYLQVTIDREEKIIGPNGAVYTLGVDDLSMLEGLTFGDVSNGFILMGMEEVYNKESYKYEEIPPHYVSLDGSAIIDSAKISSSP